MRDDLRGQFALNEKPCVKVVRATRKQPAKPKAEEKVVPEEAKKDESMTDEKAQNVENSERVRERDVIYCGEQFKSVNKDRNPSTQASGPQVQ